MFNIPNFAWLRAFEAAARLESFNAAANELHLTPSAISHQIKNLEDYFGTPLFIRKNRRVTLNWYGQKFYRNLQPSLDALAVICSEMQGVSEQNRSLVLHCAPSLAVKWLGPRLKAFIQMNPDLLIDLRADALSPDLWEATDIDCAICYGDAPINNPHIIVEPLAPEPIVPMCSPSIYKTRSLSHPWYRVLPLITSTISPVSWDYWFASNGMAVPLGQNLSFDRGAMAITAAVDGLGVVLETVRFAEKELENGQLMILPSPNGKIIRRDIHYLYYRNNLDSIRRVEKLRSWLLKEAKFSIVSQNFMGLQQEY